MLQIWLSRFNPHKNKHPDKVCGRKIPLISICLCVLRYKFQKDVGLYLHALSVLTCIKSNLEWDLKDAKSLKRHSKTEYKAFTQLKQWHKQYVYNCIQTLIIFNWGNNRLQILKYAPINTQNIGFIIENIEQNTLFINVQVLMHSLLNSLTKFENRP